MGNAKHEHQIITPSASLLQTALTYSEKLGFSVIPVRSNKKAHIKWEPFQKKRATREEIIGWWNRWPMAMIGIITGSISGVVVIDIDSAEGEQAVQEYIPDSLVIPTCQTPRGGKHLYFKHPGKPIPNNARIVPGCDFRGDGGLVIAPPSVNMEGKAYAWIEGFSIHEVEPPLLPESYISFILKKAFVFNKEHDDQCRQESSLSSNVVRMFTQGRRDEDLFHVANCLVKGGMPSSEIQKSLEILAKSCDPPFPLKEIPAKIESALKRAERRERNLAEEVREWVLSSSGVFLSSEVAQCLHVSSRDEQKNLSKILSRFSAEGLIERYGNKNSCFRRVENECEEIDFLNAPNESFAIRWPFGIEEFVRTLPKNVIVIAGEPNAGKTAFLLNVIQMNMADHPIYYFSSEMGPIELAERLKKFGQPLSEWRFTAKERSSNFADVIYPDAVNLIDYLEIHKDFWEVGGRIKEIYDRLVKGIAVIALQKNRGTDYGLGGMKGLEKARLYLAMEPRRMKIVKAKHYASRTNPNGLELNFKLVQGWEFLREGDWH